MRQMEVVGAVGRAEPILGVVPAEWHDIVMKDVSRYIGVGYICDSVTTSSKP